MTSGLSPAFSRSQTNPEGGALPPAVLDGLRRIVGDEGIVLSAAARTVYECDGYTLARSVPEAVVLPADRDQAIAVVRLLGDAGIGFVPRGAGTGLSGGCLPLQAPVMVGTARMRRILRLDPEERIAVVEPGVVNLDVSRAARPYGLHYAPDPSSQAACTIGGNVAENSGGPHTLKYGVTTNHVLGLEMVLADGRVVELGGEVEDVPGYDLRGFAIGSEGTLGLVTRITLRLVPSPPACRTLLAVFAEVEPASHAVSAIVARGIVPAALEMMDRVILKAVEAAYGFGFPEQAGAVLIAEVDGPEAGLDSEAAEVERACRECGALEVRRARDAAERDLLWKSRKRAFGAVGRLAPNYCTQDGVVPRSALAEILARIRAIAARHRLQVGNVFHAGDGNIHPILLYDERDEDQVRRVVAAGREILRACVELGGSVTGEHGIGVEKIAELGLMFSVQDLELMGRLRAVFDPRGLCNPGKVLPRPGGCVEVIRPRRQVPL